MRVAYAIALAGSAALLAPSCFDAIVEPDAGFHIAIGRLILRSGIPHTNALSWIARDEPWFPNAWLFDAACAALTNALGPLGLQIFVFALGVATVALVGLLLGEGVWLLPAVALLLEPRLQPRPHAVTWVTLAAVLLLCRRGRRWAAVPLIVLGANFHAGAAFAAFVAGIYFLDAWLRTRDARELAGAAASGLALLANPGGLYDARYLWAHLSVQQVIPLSEFGPPRWPVSAFFLLAVPVALYMGVRLVRKERALLVVCVVFAALGCIAARLEYEFLIVAAPLLGQVLALARERAGPRVPALGAALAFGLAVLQSRYDTRLAVLDSGPKFDAAVLPVRAARYLAEAGLGGPHFNSFDDGGYLSYALPGVPVFIDGRVQAYPPALFQRLREAHASPAAFDRFLREIGASWALVQRRKAETTGDGLLDGAAGWALVYWDDINEVFVRREDPRWAGIVARDEFHIWRPGVALSALADAPLRSARAEVDRFVRFSPRNPAGEVAACILAARSAGTNPGACLPAGR